MNVGDPLEWYFDIPIVSRVYITASVLVHTLLQYTYYIDTADNSSLGFWCCYLFTFRAYVCIGHAQIHARIPADNSSML